MFGGGKFTVYADGLSHSEKQGPIQLGSRSHDNAWDKIRSLEIQGEVRIEKLGLPVLCSAATQWKRPGRAESDPARQPVLAPLRLESGSVVIIEGKMDDHTKLGFRVDFKVLQFVRTAVTSVMLDDKKK